MKFQEYPKDKMRVNTGGTNLPRFSIGRYRLEDELHPDSAMFQRSEPDGFRVSDRRHSSASSGVWIAESNEVNTTCTNLESSPSPARMLPPGKLLPLHGQVDEVAMLQLQCAQPR